MADALNHFENWMSSGRDEQLRQHIHNESYPVICWVSANECQHTISHGVIVIKTSRYNFSIAEHFSLTIGIEVIQFKEHAGRSVFHFRNSEVWKGYLVPWGND